MSRANDVIASNVVQPDPALGEHRLRLLGRVLKLSLAIPVLSDARRYVFTSAGRSSPG